MEDATGQVKTLASDPAKRGLECRRCGCRDLRVDHASGASGRIIRYRHCRHCGKRVTTSERIIGS